MIVVVYCHAGGCECCAACLSDESRSDVSAGHSDLGSNIRATKELQ